MASSRFQALLWDFANRDCWVSHSALLENKQTNKQTGKQENSCQEGLCHVNAACGPVPKHCACWFCGAPVLRHNFWSCICHVVIAVIQCQVSGVFCMWYLCLPLRVTGTLLWNKISPDFCYKSSTDKFMGCTLPYLGVCRCVSLLSEIPNFE